MKYIYDAVSQNSSSDMHYFFFATWQKSWGLRRCSTWCPSCWTRWQSSGSPAMKARLSDALLSDSKKKTPPPRERLCPRRSSTGCRSRWLSSSGCWCAPSPPGRAGKAVAEAVPGRISRRTGGSCPGCGCTLAGGTPWHGSEAGIGSSWTSAHRSCGEWEVNVCMTNPESCLQ